MENDPIEDDPRYQSIFETIDAEVEAMLELEGLTMKSFGLGWCHTFWYRKKSLLKEKYGIDWKSPREMNPNVFFD